MGHLLLVTQSVSEPETSSQPINQFKVQTVNQSVIERVYQSVTIGQSINQSEST